MNLDQKLMELKKLVSIMQKDAEGHGYTYVKEESILLAINDKMIELGLKLTPKFKAGTLHSEVVNYQNAKGQPKTDVLVRSEMEFIWKDIESGEIEIIDWGLVGQQADANGNCNRRIWRNSGVSYNGGLTRRNSWKYI